MNQSILELAYYQIHCLGLGVLNFRMGLYIDHTVNVKIFSSRKKLSAYQYWAWRPLPKSWKLYMYQYIRAPGQVHEYHTLKTQLFEYMKILFTPDIQAQELDMWWYNEHEGHNQNCETQDLKTRGSDSKDGDHTGYIDIYWAWSLWQSFEIHNSGLVVLVPVGSCDL